MVVYISCFESYKLKLKYRWRGHHYLNNKYIPLQTREINYIFGLIVFSIINSDILTQQKVLIDNYTEGFNFTIKI